MTDDLLYQIAITRISDIGIQKAKMLISYFGSAKEVFKASKQELQDCFKNNDAAISGLLSQKDKTLHDAEKEFAFINQHKISTYFYFDSNYPSRLYNYEDAPLLLYTTGNINMEATHTLSVVGTRMPTDRGVELCKQIIRDIARQMPDTVIVSGLAYGIDVTAHRTAIETNLPTFIIPAHGLDRIYPYEHREVAKRATKNGGIITEYPSGTRPEAYNFLARNRIIAMLGDATLVVESKIKGGSLSTARRAFEYGKTVFAIPGRTQDERSAGCNMIIKNGIAQLVENADDILFHLRWERARTKKEEVQTELFVSLPPEEEKILNVLRTKEDGMYMNELLQLLNATYSDVSSLLILMEMKGLLKSLPGNIYRALK